MVNKKDEAALQGQRQQTTKYNIMIDEYQHENERGMEGKK